MPNKKKSTKNAMADVEEIIAATTRAVLAAQAANAMPLNMSDIGSQIPNYAESDDIECWINRVDEIKDAYNVSEQVIKVLATRQLTGRAKEWYNYTPGTIQKTWTDLKIDLKLMFKNAESHINLMKKMENRRWKTGENFSSYFYDKVHLANKLSLAEQDIVDYVVQGIDNYVLKTQALSARYTTLPQLLEAMKIMSEDKVHGNRDFPAWTPNRVNFKKPVHSMGSERTGTSPLRCFNCNLTGHRMNQCTKPKREPGSCYACGSKDHLVLNCPKRQPSLAGPADSTTHVIAEEVCPPAPALLVPIRFKLRTTDKYEIFTQALVDSGSPISLISHDIVTSDLIEPIDGDYDYVGINGSKLTVIGIFCRLVTINNLEISIKFFVVSEKTMYHACLIGRDVLCCGKIKVSITKDIKIEPKVDTPDINCENSILQIDYDAFSNSEISLDIEPSLDFNTVKDINNHFQTDYVDPPRPPNPEIDYEMKILVKPNHTPFFYRPRRLSYDEKNQVSEIIEDLLERGIIRRSTSEYSSPILVRKRPKGVRMCVDFRSLNKITLRDNYPLPLIDDHLDTLRGKKYFSKLDLKSAFHHVRLHEESVKYTSFVAPTGQYEYLYMPFGLRNSPAVFMRYINTVFRDLIDAGRIIIYVDDILIATDTVEENITILRETFKILVKNHLQLRLDKCSFMKKQITYLGYLVNETGIQPNTETIRSVTNFPIPKNQKELHSFIGLASYFRRFIQNFSIIAKPLYYLLRKNIEFQFGKEQLEAFESLKYHLVNKPILCLYNPQAETELHTDASSIGFGAILMQKQSDKLYHPVMYFSKRTVDAESRYHSFELEMLAIIYALRRLRIYLQGIPFKIVTDCNSMKLALEKKDVNPRILRWSLELQNYDYTLEHRKNKNMIHVDALSRSLCVSVILENSLDRNLCVRQNNDSHISQIRDELQIAESKFYELRDGLVYRKTEGKLLFMVPESMQIAVIRVYHDEVGHVGIDKTCELISSTYWFKNMKQKVQHYIQNCLKCIVYSPVSGKQEGYLHPLAKGNLPFHTIHIDHFGPLSKTKNGYKYLLTVIDGFTKFVKLFSCKSTNTDEVVKHLRNYFQNYSRPLRIVSDRGSAFTSNSFKAFTESQDIQHTLVAVGVPRANGQVEVVHRSITPMLSKLTKDPEKWFDVIDQVEYALNNTVNRSTGHSPSKLLFGAVQRGPDRLRTYLESILPEERDITKLRDQAKTRIEESQKANKEYYDSKHKLPHKYKVGDYVMVKNVDVTPGVNKKLLPKYRGPYEVTQELINDRYVVEDIPGYEVTQMSFKGVYDPARMKPWYTDQSLLPDS